MPSPPHAKLLRDEAYRRIREAVLKCEMPPGAQLREQELADRFGVSKSPVRDALHRLEAEGLVEVLPRKGYRIRAISLEDALELYEMRSILEGACVERVAKTASATDLNSLDEFREGPRTKTGLGWIDYNRRFHLALASICGNNRLMRATREIIIAFDRLTSASISELRAGVQGPLLLDKMDREHAEIIDAMQSRNSRRASTLMQSHVEASRSRYLATYKSPRKEMLNSVDHEPAWLPKTA